MARYLDNAVDNVQRKSLAALVAEYAHWSRVVQHLIECTRSET